MMKLLRNKMLHSDLSNTQLSHAGGVVTDAVMFPPVGIDKVLRVGKVIAVL